MFVDFKKIIALPTLCIALLVCSAFAQASVITTRATFQAENLNLPVTGPPLLNISVVRSNGGGIFTNQYTGSAATSGAIHTVVAIPINIMRDGVNYSGVGGPSSTPGSPTNLVAFIGLDGAITSLGTAAFASGRALIYETTTAFDPRDPTSWGYTGGTLLAEFVLASPETVFPGVGIGTTIAAPVPGSDVNRSIFDNLTVGDTDFQFLFKEDSPVGLTTPTTGDNWMRDLFNPLPGAFIAYEGLLIEGEQDLDQQATGDELSGPVILTAADMAELNLIAGAAGLADLGGVGTGFATGFGAGGSGPTTDYFIDLGLFPPPPAGLEGDLYANATEFNAYPVINAVPEPVSLLMWTCLISLSSMVTLRRRRSSR